MNMRFSKDLRYLWRVDENKNKNKKIQKKGI